MRIVRIESGADGRSRFTTPELTLVPKGQFGRFSALQAAPGILFREADAGYDSGWHAVPNPLYLIILAGTIEITTGTGETRTFGAGSVIHAVDTSGEGHRTRCVGAEGFRSVLVNLSAG
jgi:hypothetical protein